MNMISQLLFGNLYDCLDKREADDIIVRLILYNEMTPNYIIRKRGITPGEICKEYVFPLTKIQSVYINEIKSDLDTKLLEDCELIISNLPNIFFRI